MARNTYGLDLGSYEIKVYDKRLDSIWKEKTVLAIRDKDDVVAIGEKAYEMYGKTPPEYKVHFPMQDGVISGFRNMQFLLQKLLKGERQISLGAEYVIAVPTDVSEVQKKAFFDLVIHSNAKAKEVNIVERSIADAVGVGIDVVGNKGAVVANFGGETTELSILSEGGMVFNHLLKIGGTDFDGSIITMIKNNHDLLIGRQTAELLRRRFDIFGAGDDAVLPTAGRDLLTGVPVRKPISVNLIRAAIKEPLLQCIDEIQILIDRTPPEVRKAVYENGIYLTGGLANTPGLDQYIKKTLDIPTKSAKNPEVRSVIGLKRILMSKDLRKLAYSMTNESYRWMK